MNTSIPIIEARNKLTNLPETLQNQPELGAIAVTRRGKPVLAVMSWEFYESLLETLEVMGDEKLITMLRQSLDDIAAGKTKSWQKAKKELGL